MSIPGFLKDRKLRLKRIITDEWGHQSVHGYTYTLNNNVASPAFIVASFTHSNERPITISERQIEMRYDEWTDEDDEARKPKAIEIEPIRIMGKFCPMCGKRMWHYNYHSNQAEMRCDDEGGCGEWFNFSHPLGPDKSPNSSTWSLIHWN